MLVDAAVENRTKEVNGIIGQLRTDVEEKARDVTITIDKLRKEASEARETISKDLDTMKQNVEARANRLLIPAAAIVLLAGIVGLWGILGSVAFKVREDAASTIERIEILKTDLVTKQRDLAGLQDELDSLRSQLTSFRSNAAFPALTQKVAATERRISELDASLSKRIENLAGRLPSGGNRPTAQKK